MGAGDIYRKSAKGLAEIGDRKLKLPPRLRTMLILVDGERPEFMLKEDAERMGAPADALAQLLAAGLIERVSGVQPGAPAAAAPRADEFARFREAKNLMNTTIVDALGIKSFFFTMKLERGRQYHRPGGPPRRLRKGDREGAGRRTGRSARPAGAEDDRLMLYRYFAKEILTATFLVLAALLALFGFFDTIRELDDLGRGNYRLTSMLTYVMLSLPSHAYVLLPAAGLIGTLFALARMSENSEITVMRASGLSLAQLALHVALAGLVVALLTVLIGELVAPHTEDAAKGLRLKATRAIVAREFRSGFWVKDDRSFVNIQDVTPETELLNLKIYEFDPSYRLSAISRAEKGTYAGTNKWSLSNVELTRFEGDRAILEKVPKAIWNSVLTPDILSVLKIVPERMSGGEPAPVHRPLAREPAEGHALRDCVLEQAALPGRRHRDDDPGDPVRAHLGARGLASARRSSWASCWDSASTSPAASSRTRAS
jgi:LPS export ABC transporter permease LptG